jgi:ribosomal protein L37AE/L43A|tara:strand:- start:71 stop:319 length:249 start_codon:yes stop_codon:yes gene_type:complete
MTTVKGNFGDIERPEEQIDMKQTSPIKCEKCENQTFKETMLIRKLSAEFSPTNQETIIPIGVFACEKCGHVNSEFEKVDALQ